MPSLLSRWRWVLFAGAASVTGACAPYLPPLTHASAAPLATDAEQATLVFLWPYTGCEPGGYVTLATTDGRYLGNVGEGTQLRARMPAGDYTIMGWNEPQEIDLGDVRTGPVPVLHATVDAGRTYYVRMAFGEWDERGPSASVWVRGRQTCVVADTVITSAMEALTPSSHDWNRVPGWTQSLAPIAADRDAGQTWLDADRGRFELHRAVAVARYRRLREYGRQMATVAADDGVAMGR